MTEFSAVSAKIGELEEEFIALWRSVCEVESPTADKAGVDKVGEILLSFAEKRGWETEVLREEVSGNALLIRMNPRAPGKPVAFSGHMDTVYPVGAFGHPATKIENGRLYGPGVADCKGGIVAALLAMTALEEAGYESRPLLLLCQSDEEVGSRYSEGRTIGFICERAKEAEAFLNCEGHTPGHAAMQRKGIKRYEMIVHGKGCHSKECTQGINALTEAAYKIIELEKMKDQEGITCNCGIISGGAAVNVVPDECRVELEVRFADFAQMEKADKTVREIAAHSFLPGTSCEIITASCRVPMEKCERNDRLLEKINFSLQKAGMKPLSPQKRNGGSDASDVTAFGIPCVDSLGVTSHDIHTTRESADLSSLAETARRLSAIVLGLDDYQQ